MPTVALCEVLCFRFLNHLPSEVPKLKSSGKPSCTSMVGGALLGPKHQALIFASMLNRLDHFSHPSPSHNCKAFQIEPVSLILMSPLLAQVAGPQKMLKA